MSRFAERTPVLVVLLLLFGAAGAMALTFPPRARIYPVFVGVLGVLLGLGELAAAARRPETEAAATDAVAFRGVLPYLLWLGAYFAAAAVVGFVLASGAFVFAFLRREGRVAPVPAGLAGTAVVLFLVFVGGMLGLHWPVSLFDPLASLGLI